MAGNGKYPSLFSFARQPPAAPAGAPSSSPNAKRAKTESSPGPFAVSNVFGAGESNNLPTKDPSPAPPPGALLPPPAMLAAAAAATGTPQLSATFGPSTAAVGATAPGGAFSTSTGAFPNPRASTATNLTTGTTRTLPMKAQSTSTGHKQWTEKYRPKSLDAIAAQKQAIDLLKACCRDQEFPSFLFYGPPGVGKTTAALAFCRELFGPEDMPKRVLEMNASDERGIDAIRTRVKTFSQLSVGGGGLAGAGGKRPGLNIKVIILDEADQMTRDAQSALRRIMEQYVKTTRFIILCNYVSRIIEPIHSRCMKFEFSPLPDQDHLVHLQKICRAESISMSGGDDDLKVLLTLAQGDLRRSTTLLQMAATVFCAGGAGGGAAAAAGGVVEGGGNPNKQLGKENFYQLYQRVPEDTLKTLLGPEYCQNPSPDAALKVTAYVTKELIQKGHSIAKVLDDLFDYMRGRGAYAHEKTGLVSFPPMKVTYVSKLIAEANENIAIHRSSESIQMRHLFLQIRQCLVTPEDQLKVYGWGLRW